MKKYIIALVLLILSSPALAQQSLTPLPQRLCINDPAHGRLEVNTTSRTFRANLRGRELEGNLELFEPTPELEYIMLGGAVPGFRFFSNITYKRHASFARALLNGQGFEMWNREHFDCDGLPANVPPYEVHIYPKKVEGAAPLSVMLCAVPSDFPSLTTYLWSINGAQKTGNMVSATFSQPGIYRVRVDAQYIDIAASDEIIVVVEASSDDDEPPPPRENQPPGLQISASRLTVKPKKKGVVTFTAQAQDADGQVTEINWDFGDGTSAEGASMQKFLKRSAAIPSPVARKITRGQKPPHLSPSW